MYLSKEDVEGKRFRKKGRCSRPLPYSHTIFCTKIIAARRIRKVTNVYERKAQCKPLSETEVQIMQYLADGQGTREIATARQTSVQVIKNYTYHACQKLGADNRAHLIAVAFRAGIIK
jgi:DNA-binding NarL/FixJ family response regulator